MTGSIKDYTPNFNLIIPEFNITGWHDYLEENFRSIDAMFYNIFAINGYKGLWKNNTIYNINDVIFVNDEGEYNGRLFKVLVEHTTTSTGTFTDFYENNPTLYDRFKDATDAAISAQEARDWAVKMDGPVEDDLFSSKFYANIVNSLSTEITTLYNIRSDIQNVSLIGTEVVEVSNIKNSVQNVANNSININTVANNTTNINTTATNILDINTNATNISAINTNASNISAIQNAYSNAQSALNSKNLAQEWAISENIVDNTDYSAKYYAELASKLENPLRIGQIIHSTIPLTDAGLQPLDGTLIQGGGIYNDFVQYMANLVNLYPQCFTDETTWQNIVSSKGVCGKFVYDSVNNTIRLPKFGNKIYTQDINEEASVIGNGMTIGVTDGTDFSGLINARYETSNGIIRAYPGNYGSAVGAARVGSGAPSFDHAVGLTTDPEKSGLIADLSNITQSIDCYYYIVVATSVKTQIIVDIDNIVADLNNKADKSSFQVVSTLPANPDSNTFYFIPE